jgi:UDP-N-acetylmuramoylalanine--D-glutamate ligase
MTFQGTHAAVVGLGKSGLAAVSLLLKHGARVRAIDNRPLDQIAGASALPAEFLPQTPASFGGVDLIVLSPGVPVDLPDLQAARERGARIIGEVELAGYFLKGPNLGITGSNGKTTTTALTGHILKTAGIACQVGGNIGTAPAAMIDTSRDDQWNVLELSSFQLETISDFHCKISIALNLTPDHLDRHYTMENYAGAKRRIVETQQADAFAVLNADDPWIASYAKATKATIRWFSQCARQDQGAFVEEGMLFVRGSGLMPASEIPMRGRHNIENTLASALAASLAGASNAAIREAVRTFPGVEHRLEFVRELDGVRYFNDSKATNVDATLKAIDAFDGGLWIILGGKDKNSDYTPLAAPLSTKAKAALLIGAAAHKIDDAIRAEVPCRQMGTIDKALQEARANAKPGDTVLLAPACASFDQFENFEHRGRVFKQLVKELQ